MRTAIGNNGAGSILFPVENAPGLHGVVVIVRDDLTAEPSAHCRLVSGHDLFEMVALHDYTLSSPWASATRDGENGEVGRKLAFPRFSHCGQRVHPFV